MGRHYKIPDLDVKNVLTSLLRPQAKRMVSEKSWNIKEIESNILCFNGLMQFMLVHVHNVTKILVANAAD